MDIFSAFLASRIIERSLISFSILGASITFIVLMWNKIQQIDLNIGADDKTLKTSTTLSVPVFMLLVLVLFSYVSYSNPISVEIPKNGPVSVSGFGPLDQQAQSFADAVDNLEDLSLELLQSVQADLDAPARAHLSKIIALRAKLGPLRAARDIIRRESGNP